MKKSILTLLIILTMMPGITSAQDFGKYFVDKTLRIDYIFAGNSQKQMIAVDELNVMPRWYGKRHRLKELPMEGNGQITVRDHQSGNIIYRNSFSTLFQEWLTYPKAKTQTKSFENIFLVPMPKDTIDVTIDLRNNRREIMSTLTHQIVPDDILIRHKGENPTPFVTLHQAADTTNCIHIAYLAEGYKQEEMGLFIKDAQTATDALFAHEPFKSKKDKFNIIAVKSDSEESGR